MHTVSHTHWRKIATPRGAPPHWQQSACPSGPFPDLYGLGAQRPGTVSEGLLSPGRRRAAGGMGNCAGCGGAGGAREAPAEAAAARGEGAGGDEPWDMELSVGGKQREEGGSEGDGEGGDGDWVHVAPGAEGGRARKTARRPSKEHRHARNPHVDQAKLGRHSTWGVSAAVAAPTSDSEREEPSGVRRYKLRLRQGLCDRDRERQWCTIPFRRRGDFERSAQAIAHTCQVRWEAACKISKWTEDVVAATVAPETTFFGGTVDWDMHYLTPHGRVVAMKVLLMLAESTPAEYCPLLCTLVPLLLTHMSPAQTFAVATVMLEDAPFYMPTTRQRFRASSYAYLTLLERYFPRTSAHIEQVGADREDLLANVFTYFFMRVLPVQCVFRIIDCFLFEGHKILFRFGLGLVKMYKRQLKEEEFDAGDALWERIREFTSSAAFHFDVLQAFSFGRFGKALIRQATLQRGAIEDLEQSVNVPPLEAAESLGGAMIAIETTRMAEDHEVPDPILSDPELRTYLTPHLPMTSQTGMLRLVYSNLIHGYSLDTLVSQCANLSPLVLVVSSLDHRVRVGAFLDGELKKGQQVCCGTHTFLFRLTEPKAVHDWVGTTAQDGGASFEQYCMLRNEFLAIGGSREHHTNALRISEDMHQAWSGPSDTFGNDNLLPEEGEHGEWQIDTLEVYHIASVAHVTQAAYG